MGRIKRKGTREEHGGLEDERSAEGKSENVERFTDIHTDRQTDRQRKREKERERERVERLFIRLLAARADQITISYYIQ